MTCILKQAGRTLALWVGMVLGTVLSGIVVHQVPHAGTPDGPLPVARALLTVNAFGATVVAGLASRLTGSGWGKVAALLVVVFAVETGLSSIESAAFGQALGVSPQSLVAIDAAGLIRAAVTATVATLLWNRVDEPVPMPVPSAACVIAIVALYVVLYFAAGMFAWRSEAVRAFYRGGADFDLRVLLALQVVRGLIWTGIAFLLATRLRGSTAAAALRTGAAFAVLMAAPLLYPNAFMPWSVRSVHLVELSVSNAIFGILSILLLRRASEPVAATIDRSANAVAD